MKSCGTYLTENTTEKKKKKAKRYDLCFNVPIQTESDRFMGWEENADGFFTYCKSKKKNF